MKFYVRHVRHVRLIAAIVLILSLQVVPSFAQQGTAVVSGKVTDSSGLAVVGVSVHAVNVDTNVSYPAATNEAGIYSLPPVTPGRYRIEVEKEGFQRLVKPDVELHVADDVSIDFTLQVGAVAQTVTVEAGAPQVNTTNAQLGGLVQADEVANLPLNGRNYINMTLMQPGIAPSPNVAVGGNYNGTYYSSNGATIHSNNFSLDGAVMQGPTAGSTADYAGRTLGLDGIQEFRVITSNFSADYGLTMGSQTIMVSKGGTNQFHGTAFEYLRNSIFDARNFFDKSLAVNNFQRLPPYKRNNFGGSFGGPIQKDKTFFFATFEGVEERTGITVNDTVPAVGCHGGLGAVITNTACPQLGSTASVTIGSVSPAVVPLIALWPLPDFGTTGYTTPYSQPDRDVFGQIRVDHVFSDRDSMFGRYTINDDDEVIGLPFPELFVNPRLSRNQFLTLAETHTFSTSLLNNIRISYSRVAADRTSPDPFIGPQYSLVTGQPMGEITVSGLGATSPTYFGPIANPPAQQNQNVYTIGDTVLWTHGDHSFKFGFDGNQYRQYALQNKQVEGTLNFSGLATFLAGTSSASTAVVPGSDTSRTWLFYTTGFYAQDDWRIRHNFTLNAGLRYEPAPDYYHEVFGVGGQIINTATDASVTVGPWFKNPTYKNLSPRLGFAWDVFGNGKTSVRGGWSLMYDVANLYNGLINIQTSQPPFTLIETAGAGPFSLPLTFASGAASRSGATVTSNFKQARLYSENLTVEEQLPFSMVLSVSYVGSRGEHLIGIGEGNPNVPEGFTSGLPYWDPNPLHPQCTPTITMNCIATVNPNWTTILETTSNGDSVYNSLQVLLTKRITKGLQFQSSYTWEKSLDDNQGGSSSDCTASSNFPTDPYGNRIDRGPSCFNLPQIWVFNAIYTFPDPKFQQRFLEGMTSGWGMTGIFTLHDGFPFNPVDSTERSRSGVTAGTTSGIDRPNYNPAFTGPIITGNPAQWFNPAAFMLQPVGMLGDVQRDSLMGPDFRQLDFAVKKETRMPFLGEAGNLIFRAEFFNIFNHPNFAMPNQTTFAGTLTAPVTEAPNLTAGQITTTGFNTSRQLEFSLRVVF